MADTRPEGTDHILTGNADMSTSGSKGPDAGFRDASQPTGPGTAGSPGGIGEQVGGKARDFAAQGRDRATNALDEIAKLIADNAGQLDEALGATYGDYARRAAGYVSGTADNLRDRDVEDLLEDARDLVRRAPAAAISAGAIVGFALARIIKAGSEALDGTARTLNAAGRSADRDPAG